MKLVTGWMMVAGLVFTAAAADAQVLVPYGRSPYVAVSDVEGPYAAVPPNVAVPQYGPILLPPQEVYTVLRENGFSPLGAPQKRGLVYTISAIDRAGDDGRLVIDARTGQIIRFMPAYRMGDRLDGALTAIYGPVGPLPPNRPIRGVQRPPGSVPLVTGQTPLVPLPKASPSRAAEARELASKSAPEPARQSAVVEVKPAAPQILPTQEMPKVQGLD
jgi:hypothetical protein